MGFFKDFADEFSEAVDELMPMGGDSDDNNVAKRPNDKIETDGDVTEELNKLDGLLEKATKNVEAAEKVNPAELVPPIDERPAYEAASTPVTPAAPPSDFTVERNTTMEDKMNLDTTPKTPAAEAASAPAFDTAPASDENAVITSGMRITGDLESTGSIEVEGTINGNVRCNGKLTVTGVINGNSTSSEFFADTAKVQGEVTSSGTVKIGVGSVVIGNISASSAVIAGAVKGDIDVQGPVVVDTSAVVMGNIKSRSVQINNGAVIEGFCSQAYADVDVESVFA